MSNLNDLQRDAATLPSRLVDAVLSGDGDQVIALTDEKAALPVRIFAAEIVSIQEEIAELRAGMAEEKAEMERKGAIVISIRAEIHDAQKRELSALREAGIAQNVYQGSQARLQELQRRIEDIASQQAQLATTLTRAPGFRPRPY